MSIVRTLDGASVRETSGGVSKVKMLGRFDLSGWAVVGMGGGVFFGMFERRGRIGGNSFGDSSGSGAGFLGLLGLILGEFRILPFILNTWKSQSTLLSGNSMCAAPQRKRPAKNGRPKLLVLDHFSFEISCAAA